MRELEEKGQELGITKLLMMENAGSSIANYVHRILARKKNNRDFKIVGICGTGNNGGDVSAAIRHLAYWPNFALSVVLVGAEKDIHAQEARINWEILSRVPKIRKVVIENESNLDILDKEISNADALIIGIFGTGFKGSPRNLQLKVIKMINRARRPLKVSADIPSGMEADSGISEYAVKSNVTVTMHAPKKGMLTKAGRGKAGKIIEANLGLPF
jgi:hydroxyethylthiazole kinase-like uncharacterized protein yjeF